MSENSKISLKESLHLRNNSSKLPPLVQKKIVQKLSTPINHNTISIKSRNVISPIPNRDEITIETTAENTKNKNFNLLNMPRSPSNDIIKIKKYNNILKPIDITKKKSNNNMNKFSIKLPKINISKKKIRTDRNGVEINHKNKKKEKVTFIDQIEDIPFTDVVEIENLKQYNVMYGIREGKEIYVRETCCTKACYIY